MPRFEIIPKDQPEAAIEIDCLDAGSALLIANQIGCNEADVHEDGAYRFSVRTLGGKTSFWQIFQRESPPGGPEVISAG